MPPAPATCLDEPVAKDVSQWSEKVDVAQLCRVTYILVDLVCMLHTFQTL